MGELFDTLVVFENYPVDRAVWRRTPAVCGSTDVSGPRCHALSAEPCGRCRASSCSCGSTIAPTCSIAPSVEALAARLVRLLEAAVAEPDRAIGRLDILVAGERHTILRGVERHRAADRRRDACRSCSRRRRRETPDAVAVVFEDEQRSAMASSMPAPTSWRITCAALGVGPEVVVGLCVERSPEMVVGLLGILKAGGAYLPLDPDYPHERLAFMLDDAGAAVLVTQAALLDAAARDTAPTIVRLDADWPADRARSPRTAPPSRPRPAQPRLCHLHLGIDRNPKGRGGQHGGIRNLAAAQIERFAITRDDRAFCSSPRRASMPRSRRSGCRS